MNPPLAPVRRALLSVSDKTGLLAFARGLERHGVRLLSTGGTAQALGAAGIAVTEVSAVTGFPEMLDGRLKTLHPAIHGGLLARRDRPDHLAALEKSGIATIDLLVSNLYPFALKAAAGASPEECIENIDIGGPALIRAAAKNHDAVAVVTDPSQYEPVLAEMDAHEGAIGKALRRALAREAFALTAAYDAAIAEWLERADGILFPPRLVLAAERAEGLRYGENPHQKAAFYRTGGARRGIASARQLQGKEPSYNNYVDADAAFALVADLASPAAAIVKHTNPCGAALGRTLLEAWEKALACDPTSAFGGVVAFNSPLDEATAEAMARIFVEVVIVPQVGEAAAERLRAKSALRLLVTGGLPDPAKPSREFRSLAGGLLLQEGDLSRPEGEGWRPVTRRSPSMAERKDLLFAAAIAKHVKSNAIVFARGGATVGIGAGQMSRVDAVRIAAMKAAASGQAAGFERSPSEGSVLASDAFFPFADGIEAAIAAGVTAVIQPGGSRRDEEVIAAADKAGMAMVFTGTRHFRH
jgi:phosphoribosylaminoimidazolecarboxamide formyltransferase / IMP cyclohydrolase